MTFPRSVLDALATRPEHAAVEHGDQVVTGGELLAMIGTIVGGLRSSGIGPGSSVAMDLDVSAESLAAYLAGYALGSRVIGVHPGYSASQRRHVLSRGVDTVLTGERVAEFLRGPAADPVVLARPDDVARVVYTSGSTGQPKGCMQTYAALSWHWSWGVESWCADTAELAARTGRYLLFGSLSSAVVQDYLALCLLSGGTAVIPRPPAAGTGPLFPGVFQRLHATATIMNVPRLYQMLDSLRHGDCDLSTVGAIMVAGSPLPAHRLAEAAQRLGPVLYSSYGQTETGGLTALTPADIAGGVLASVGRPLPGVDVAIKEGEILVRSPYQMCGYLDEPELTAEVLVDGWVRTRDLGRLEGGYLYLTGRAREVIIVDAMPVYAGPIERVLTTAPDVDQAYVVGAPDDRRGEAVHAFVVPRAERSLDHAALRAAVRAELGELSVPETITELAQVPVAISGKPDKSAMLDLRPLAIGISPVNQAGAPEVVMARSAPALTWSCWRTDRPPRSFLCAFITQENAVTGHHGQRPRIDRISVSSSASRPADSRRSSGGSPRSVHALGSVICPLTPPEHTKTVSAPRRLAYRTSSRWPFSGWNGWMTTTEPERSLGTTALCRARRYPELAELAAFLRDHHLPHRHRPELAGLQRAPDLLQERPGPDPVLDAGHRGRIDPGGPPPVVPGHARPCLGQEQRVVNEVEQVTEPAGGVFSRPAVQLGLHLPYFAYPRLPHRRGVTLCAGIPRRVFGHYSSFH
jgi:fatty-acyl-CoA synthase